MVNSKLNPEINYVENKGLDPEDLEFDAQPWEVTMLGEDITIALGNPKYQYSKNIIYYPIYLIKNNTVDSQIGVYEVIADQLPSLLDEDDDLDIDALEPLLFSFVNKGLLYTETGDDVAQDDDDDESEEDDINDPDDEEEEEEEEEDELDVVGSVDVDNSKTIVIDESVAPMPELSSQTEEDAAKEREKVTGNRPWVAKFMSNQNYEIQEVGGGGDCLFHVIRHALGTIGKRTSISKLRALLAKEATEPFLKHIKLFLIVLNHLYKKINRKKALVSENYKLKEARKNTNDRAKQIEIVDRAKELKAEYARIKSEDKASSSMYNEYKFMEGVTNLQAFKDVIKTCKFWGETWSISTLERALNIKLILLSKQHYTHGDMANVLQCGQLNDEVLQKQGIFEPDHYIIANFTGNHYQCVQYKGRSIFKFKEIPYDIKLKI